MGGGGGGEIQANMDKSSQQKNLNKILPSYIRSCKILSSYIRSYKILSSYIRSYLLT